MNEYTASPIPAHLLFAVLVFVDTNKLLPSSSSALPLVSTPDLQSSATTPPIRGNKISKKSDTSQPA